MHTLLLLVEAVLSAVGLCAVVQLTLYIYARQRNEHFFTTQARLDDAARTTVKEIQQVCTEDYKKARVDHRLKTDTAHELRATAVKSVIANLGPLGMREVRRVLGLSRKAPIDRVLVCRLEAAVYDLKGKRAPRDDIVPSSPSKRFSPDTIRIPRAQLSLPPEEEPEPLYDETTPKGGQ